MLYVLMIHIVMDIFDIMISMINYILYVINIIFIYRIKMIWKNPIFLTHTPAGSLRPRHLLPPSASGGTPTDHSGIEEYISRYVQLYSPHVKAVVAGLTCPVAGVVVDIFCMALFDVAYRLGVTAYVYLITSAMMCALLLRSPALDEEVAVEVEFEQMEGGVDVPGLPPVPASCLPTGLENRKIPTYRWFLYNGATWKQQTSSSTPLPRSSRVSSRPSPTGGALVVSRHLRCTRSGR
jgi:hypothetical protein